MYNKTDRKVKPTIVKDYCTFGVSITELQVRYTRSFRMETRTQGWKNILSVNIKIYRPYRKPNNDTRYINPKSNHPPFILRQIAAAISKQISINSSNKHFKKYHHAITS